VALIEISGLTKRYPRVTALDALTVDVQSGIVGLVGANGAGKSTLIKILLGLVAPTTGQVRILGLDPARDGDQVRARVEEEVQLRVGDVGADHPAAAQLRHLHGVDPDPAAGAVTAPATREPGAHAGPREPALPSGHAGTGPRGAPLPGLGSPSADPPGSGQRL